MYSKPIFLPAGDQALVVELGDSIDPEINRRARRLTLAVEKARLPGVSDLVPTYRSLLLYYDPAATSAKELEASIVEIDSGLDQRDPEPARTVHIPTMYGGEYGPDIEFVAQQAGLTTEEVVRIHSGTDYLVYMLGFAPGFPYLGGLSERLNTPRLDTPRGEIAAGSVGIAEGQTGVYPVATPGGWRLIGRTPLKMFDSAGEPPALLSPGDYVRFVPLESEEEYLDIERRHETGDYDITTEAAS